MGRCGRLRLGALVNIGQRHGEVCEPSDEMAPSSSRLTASPRSRQTGRDAVDPGPDIAHLGSSRCSISMR
jgi:hypothetical protein